jgi:hypothetical protein
VQHDLRPVSQPILGLVAVGHLLQPLALRGAQGYRTDAGNGQGRQPIERNGSRTSRSLSYPATDPWGRMGTMPTPSEHTQHLLKARLAGLRPAARTFSAAEVSIGLTPGPPDPPGTRVRVLVSDTRLGRLAEFPAAT